MNINSRLILAGLASSFLSVHIVSAEESDDVAPQPQPTIQPFAGVGLTIGGDKLAKVVFTNNASENINAGELFDLKGGILFNSPNLPLTLQTSIGVQFDMVSANNGDISFFRFPLDALCFYNVGAHRVGAGITYHMNPELEIDTPTLKDTLTFDNAQGLVVEYGYQFSPEVTAAIRYVTIDYEISEGAFRDKVSGDHLGLYAYITF